MLYRQAILHPDPSSREPVTVSWNEPGGESAAVPDVAGLSFVDLGSERNPGSSSAEFISARRLLDKSRTLERYLGLPEQTFQPAAMCETFETGAQVQIDAYIRTHLASERAYYLHFRGTEDLEGRAPGTDVRFVTGPCLFSGRMLDGRDVQGNRVNLLHPRNAIKKRLAEIVADEQLSLYELEGCVRQARLIADLAAALPGSCKPTVTLDVPREQYYCYLLEGLAAGLVSKELMWRWVAMVDLRYEQVTGVLADQVRFWFERAGLPAPKLSPSAGLKGLREELLDAIERQAVPEVGSLVDNMAKLSPTWSLIREVAPPTSLKELGYCSYSAEYLAGMSPEQPADGLLIGVEDRTEVKIYQGAKRISRLARKFRPGIGPAMLGLYPQPQVLLAGTGKSSLYLNDPGTRFRDDLGEYSSQELLEMVYGCEIAPVLI